MNLVPRFDYRVIEETLTVLDCPRSLTCLILLRHSEFEQIVNLSFHPHDYNNLKDARDSLQATELLRKHEDLPTKIDKTRVAYDSFIAAESVCKETNLRLINRNDCASQLFVASRKISEVLGSFTPVEFLDCVGWGPGSTLKIKRRDASPSNKFRCEAEVTLPLYKLLKPWFASQFPNWHPSFHVYEGNKVITVPKNAKTERTIAVEPSINLFFQKGVGTMLRRRLSHFGVHLNDQTFNQSKARSGSRYNKLATVDFSAASDTISSQLILDLLPFNWFEVLDVLRSSRGLLHDSIIEYEKFSSMGNGFTFELESLIFWALAKACVPTDHLLYDEITVYGDDVIIPCEFISQYRALCDYCGFSVNEKKSFSDSYYRESCGKHYWDGIDITPVYLRRFLTGSETMKFHNRIVELSMITIGPFCRDKRFKGIISLLAQNSTIKCRIPVGYGDVGLISDFDIVTPVFNRELQRGWLSKAYISVAKRVFEDDEYLHLMHLLNLMKRDSDTGLRDFTPIGNDVTYSSRTNYKYKTLWFVDWPYLGTWV